MKRGLLVPPVRRDGDRMGYCWETRLGDRQLGMSERDVLVIVNGKSIKTFVEVRNLVGS